MIIQDEGMLLIGKGEDMQQYPQKKWGQYPAILQLTEQTWSMEFFFVGLIFSKHRVTKRQSW